MSAARLAALAALGLLIQTSSSAAVPSKTDRLISHINKKCHLRAGVLTNVADEVHLAPAPDEKYEQIDCALALLKRGNVQKMGFIGNEIDPSTKLTRPYQYIAGGTLIALQHLADEVRQAGWLVQSLAKANDGTGFLTFRSPDGMTYGQAEPFMDKLFNHQLGEITFGPAPTATGGIPEQD